MEANQLMIGNYVNTNRAHGKGQKQLKTVQINLHYLQQIENNCNYIEPIPLTEEWLLRFGFEKDIEYDNTFNLGISVLNGFTTITIDVRAEVLLLDCMEIKIKHVHQLQNLYFALTGTHLTLK